MLVMCIADGYDRIPESFKAYAREKKFLDESILIEKGFMEETPEGVFKMRDLKDCMDEDARDKAPQNLLHCFQVTARDFGLNDPLIESKRISFIFAVKHRNDGKINSHKWFF